MGCLRRFCNGCRSNRRGKPTVENIPHARASSSIVRLLDYGPVTSFLRCLQARYTWALQACCGAVHFLNCGLVSLGRSTCIVSHSGRLSAESAVMRWSCRCGFRNIWYQQIGGARTGPDGGLCESLLFKVRKSHSLLVCMWDHSTQG